MINRRALGMACANGWLGAPLLAKAQARPSGKMVKVAVIVTGGPTTDPDPLHQLRIAPASSPLLCSVFGAHSAMGHW